MGNSNCYIQEEVKIKECIPIRTRRVLMVKNKLKKRIQLCVKQFKGNTYKSEFQSVFMNFFNITLNQLIKNYDFPKPGKDFLQSGYKISLANIEDISQQMQKDETDMELLLIRNLMDDINTLKEKSLFYLILQQFNEFYKLLFSGKNEKLDTTIVSPNIHFGSGTKSFINTQIPLDFLEKQKTIDYDDCTITKRKISSIVKEDENVLPCIMISIVHLFDLLKDILQLTYTEILQDYIKQNDIEKYIQNNLVFQKIIQHYIYDEAFCVGKLIEVTVQLFYQPPQTQYDGIIYTEKPTYLDVTLYPEPGQFTMIKELDEEDFLNESAKIRKDIFYRSSSRMSVIEMQQKIMIAISQIEKENIPYKELFVILKQMFEEIKPYRIFLLIQQLSEEIVQMYLQSRPQDQQDKYRELILAEDNKLSIILFLLHKFQESIGCNLNRLYNKLRFMMDYDSILDNKIKYELDQSFVRFYACLEMIVQTP